MNDELAERVERGAALLDERRPGWWDEVDLGALDLLEPCRCPLGQLWGDYVSGIDAVLTQDIARFAGGAFGHGFDDADERYPDLTDLWRAAIERRRAQVTA